MSQPYPSPVAIKTKLRCKFSLPGKRYNCRAIGKYVLDGKGYCAHHYDIAWKVLNQIYGQAHDWHVHVNRFTGIADNYPSCRRCGDIKVYDGLPQGTCGGVLPRIVLRSRGAHELASTAAHWINQCRIVTRKNGPPVLAQGKATLEASREVKELILAAFLIAGRRTSIADAHNYEFLEAV